MWGEDRNVKRSIGRWAVLLLITWAMVPGTVGRSADGARTSPSRPNVLLIIADDWSFPHAGIYGDKIVRTPHFDRLAREGALFHHAYAASPSCTPSRGAVLTGRAVHQLAEGGNLWSSLSTSLAVYPDLLEAQVRALAPAA